MGRNPLKGALRFAPSIIMLALAGGIVVKSFGGDIVDYVNTIKLEKEFDEVNNNTDETSYETPVFTDDFMNSFNHLNESLDELEEIDEAKEQEETEDASEEEEPEETHYVSDELLQSGYEFQDINFDELIERNNEVDAWIEIQGTNIDYPIMHTPEKDNPETGEYYYLHHDIDGNESKSGLPFLYSQNRSLNNAQEDISSVSLLFAHHMRGGKMFAQLYNYVNQSFYDEHPFAVIYTPDGYAFKVSFFAGVISGPKTSESIDVSNEGLFNDFVANVKENSTFKSDVDVDYGDKLMIMYTCEYTGGNNSKYILYGIVEKQYTNELQISNNDEQVACRLR